MNDPIDHVEEEEQTFDVEEGATGRRWGMSLVLVVVGGLCLLGGGLVVVFGAATEVAVVLIVAGAVLVAIGALMGGGSTNVTTSASPDGADASAELPKSYTLRTKKLRRRLKRPKPVNGPNEHESGGK
jgi:hypothetical protein